MARRAFILVAMLCACRTARGDGEGAGSEQHSGGILTAAANALICAEHRVALRDVPGGTVGTGCDRITRCRAHDDCTPGETVTCKRTLDAEYQLCIDSANDLYPEGAAAFGTTPRAGIASSVVKGVADNRRAECNTARESGLKGCDPRRPVVLAAVPAPDEPAGGPELRRRDVIERVNEALPDLQICAERQFQADPDLHGRLNMRWRVLTNGKTTDVECLTPELADSVYQRCVRMLISHWEFRPHEVQGSPIEFPFPL